MAKEAKTPLQSKWCCPLWCCQCFWPISLPWFGSYAKGLSLEWQCGKWWDLYEVRYSGMAHPCIVVLPWPFEFSLEGCIKGWLCTHIFYLLPQSPSGPFLHMLSHLPCLWGLFKACIMLFGLQPPKLWAKGINISLISSLLQIFHCCIEKLTNTDSLPFSFPLMTPSLSTIWLKSSLFLVPRNWKILTIYTFSVYHNIEPPLLSMKIFSFISFLLLLLLPQPVCIAELFPNFMPHGCREEETIMCSLIICTK